MAFSDYMTVNNIVAIILGIIGLIWLISALMRNRKIGKISSWPKTNATILNSVIESETTSKRYGTTTPGTAFFETDNSTSTKYFPRVLYSYNVNGKDYQSTSVAYDRAQSYSALDIRTIMMGLSPGTTISVYYNPDKPSESYIYNVNKTYTGIIVSILILLVAIAIAVHHNVIQKKGMMKYFSTETTTETPLRKSTTIQTTEVMNPSKVETRSFKRYNFM